MNLRDEIKKLSDAEKILLVEEIWDDIAENSKQYLTKEQQEELQRRVQLVEEGKMKYYTIQESLARLKSLKKDV